MRIMFVVLFSLISFSAYANPGVIPSAKNWPKGVPFIFDSPKTQWRVWVARNCLPLEKMRIDAINGGPADGSMARLLPRFFTDRNGMVKPCKLSRAVILEYFTDTYRYVDASKIVRTYIVPDGFYRDRKGKTRTRKSTRAVITVKDIMVARDHSVRYRQELLRWMPPDYNKLPYLEALETELETKLTSQEIIDLRQMIRMYRPRYCPSTVVDSGKCSR